MKEKAALSRGARKHIRIEKARIRRELLDDSQKQEQIEKLYQKFTTRAPLKESSKESAPAMKRPAKKVRGSKQRTSAAKKKPQTKKTPV
jgi:hypothetical protein